MYEITMVWRTLWTALFALPVLAGACVSDDSLGPNDAAQDGSVVDVAAETSGDAAADGPITAQLPPPRPVAPLSTSTVTSQKPTLHWKLASGTDGAQVDLCKDRACTNVIATLQASGESVAPASPLPAGVVFWRLRARAGNALGIATSPTWQFVVNARSAPVDTSWGTTPDVNGDGYADLLVGASMSAYVFLGGANGLSLTPATTLTEPASSEFGRIVTSAGDVNGDGFADVIATDAYASGAGLDGGTAMFVGKAYVYLGGASGLATTPSVTLLGADGANGYFGGSAASAGDVNGDGYADVVVSACSAAGSCTGRVYVYLGGPNGLSATPATTLTGSASAYFGMAVAGAGDVNGDGYADVAVGAWDTQNGEVAVFLGGATGLTTTPATTLQVQDQNANFGYSVACAGDVNGDGYADLVGGGPHASSDAGKAYVFLGAASGLGTTPATLSAPNAGEFGWSVASAGDIDGDGLADVVVGARVVGGNLGAAYVYLGTATGIATTPQSLAAPDGGDFGFSVAGAGDVDGDGYGDLAIGAPNANGYAGKAYLYLGSKSGLKATPAEPNAAGGDFGVFVARCSKVVGEAPSLPITQHTPSAHRRIPS